MNKTQSMRVRIAGAAFALGALASLAAPARAADYKIIVPAAPGGGWDQLGRARRGRRCRPRSSPTRCRSVNAAGAGGTIGLAQLINNNKGDGNALMVSGKGMVSAIFINKSPVTLTKPRRSRG